MWGIFCWHVVMMLMMMVVVVVCPPYTLAQATPSQPPHAPISTSGGVSTGTTGVTPSPSSESFSTSPAINDVTGDIFSVTELELSGVTMKLCTHRHLCSSLGCHFQPFEDANRTGATPLCQCDPDCIFFNDCCQDYNKTCEPWTVGEELSSHLTGLQLGDTTCYQEETRLPLEVKKGYYIIATCPEEALVRYENTWFLCDHIDSNDFLSTILVSGVKYNLPYRNVYCALCHGEDLVNLNAWPLNIECEYQDISEEALNLLSNSTSSATLSYIRNILECIVQPKPPDQSSTIFRSCFLGIQESCPEGHVQAEACASYTAFVLTAISSLELLQSKNPHCAACHFDLLPLFISCEDYYPILLPLVFTPYNPPGPHIDSGIPPISIVLDFRSGGSVKLVREQEVVVEERVTCLPNEVFDPFLKSCRKLSCLLGYVLIENQCIKGITTIQGKQDIVIYIHVTSCSSETKEGTQKAVKSCLAGLLNVNQGLIEQSAIVPETIQANCSHGKQQKYSNALMIQSTLKTFLDFHQKIQMVEGVFCPYLQIIAIEIIYHRAKLSLGKCNGQWMNETQFHKNGSGLVFVNESASWYAANQTLQREMFIHEELSSDFNQSDSLQLCLNPDLSCPLETFNSSLFLHDAQNSDILTYMPTGKTYRREQYVETWSGQIQVCSFNEQNGTRNTTRIITFFEYSLPQQIMSLILNIISMLAALITFITYCVFKELRNHTGCLIMNFVGTLFIAQMLLLFSGVATFQPSVCTTVAVLAHYFLLVNVLWTGTLAFNLYRTFTSHLITSRNTISNMSKASMTFAWGIPVLIILPCLILHLCDCTDIPLWYSNENICWIGNEYSNIAVVGVPIGVVICVNVILFSFTVHEIRKTNKTTKMVHNTSTMQQMRKELIIYIKISNLMGFTWIIGFAAAFSDAILLWYIFIILNSCQGLLVFLSFVCKISIWRQWKTFFSKCRHCCHGNSEDADRVSMNVHVQPGTSAKTCTTGI